MIELVVLYLTLSIAEQQAINTLACDMPEADSEYTLGFHRSITYTYEDGSEFYFNKAFNEAIVYDTEGKAVYSFGY